MTNFTYNETIEVLKTYSFHSFGPSWDKLYPAIFLIYTKERTTDNYLYEVQMYGFGKILGEEYKYASIHVFKNLLTALDFYTDKLMEVMRIAEERIGCVTNDFKRI